MKRRIFLAGLPLLTVLAGPAAAEKLEPKEFYTPLPPIVLEFWDNKGLFHMVNLELSLVFAKPGIKANKKLVDDIGQALTSMPWEEFKEGNPAVTIKQSALEVVKADPDIGAEVTDVLIKKLMLR